QAWKSLYPRSWFPLLTGDRGMTAIGASTFGADALGWHQYAATAQYEVENHEPLASFEYLYREQHLLAFKRDLSARTWDPADKNKVTSYDRNTQAQWLSLLPWLKEQRRVLFGVGAALDQVDRVHPQFVASAPPKDERIVAGLVDHDTSNGNWWSEGTNRGQHATLLYESYKPFAKNDTDYDGDVVRLDWRGFVPLGRSVLALRYTEARAHGRTEPFQVGGAVDPHLQLGIALNNRDISLRGYRGDEPGLLGANARVASFEWRTPIADIDRHWMVPAVGINRLSAVTFFDIGGAWDSGNRPDRYHRGIGAELLAETKLLYILPIQWRLGVARGLDAPKSTRGYVSIGRSF
ncbi:MAG TPA: hypothetical protein VE029_06160, partial [Rhizobacter sp.]|nr:hypothetical protein [Rhizobacter sp.]